MLFVLRFDFLPDQTHKVVELWKHFRYPPGIQVIGRYVLIGRHTSVAIIDAPDEESLIKLVGPFSSLGTARIAPAMRIEDALKISW